jgi:uncharacterized membrane protein YoaK (UPF0700 family)
MPTKSAGATTDPEPIKRDLILLLAFTGGWVDAVSYLVLVRIFVAHMSGNSIGMTVALGLGDWPEAFRRGFPIPLFVLGGSRLLENGVIDLEPRWRFYLLVALPALAMGLQNATLHRAGGQTIRTTYISGVLNSFSEDLVKYLFGEVRSTGMIVLLLCVWLCYVAGGVIAILTERQLQLGCLVVPIGCVLLVMAYDLVRPLARETR